MEDWLIRHLWVMVMALIGLTAWLTRLEFSVKQNKEHIKETNETLIRCETEEKHKRKDGLHNIDTRLEKLDEKLDEKISELIKEVATLNGTVSSLISRRREAD